MLPTYSVHYIIIIASTKQTIFLLVNIAQAYLEKK